MVATRNIDNLNTTTSFLQSYIGGTKNFNRVSKQLIKKSDFKNIFAFFIKYLVSELQTNFYRK